MLALATGWTQRIIAGEGPDGISDEFRRACHVALWARALREPLAEAERVARQADAIDLTRIPTEQRAAVRRTREIAAQAIAGLRAGMGLDADG